MKEQERQPGLEVIDTWCRIDMEEAKKPKVTFGVRADQEAEVLGIYTTASTRLHRPLPAGQGHTRSVSGDGRNTTRFAGGFTGQCKDKPVGIYYIWSSSLYES